jgi:hypothetical protein
MVILPSLFATEPTHVTGVAVMLKLIWRFVLTETVAEAVQLLELPTVTEYTPSCAEVALLMLGFCTVAEKLPGPAQL